MLYYNFKNYEEFKQLFGIIEHGNGTKSRNNRILLAMFKSKGFIRNFLINKEEYGHDYNFNSRLQMYWRWTHCTIRPYNICWDCVTSMQALKSVCHDLIEDITGEQYPGCYQSINGLHFYSNKYKIDDFGGLCEDGDTRAVRYLNAERDGRAFKMKAGKFLRNIIEDCPKLDSLLPEQVKIWICEEFAEQWKAYASSKIKINYKLHVDDDFESIYSASCCKGDFQSCMTDNGYYKFYESAIKAKAAYLTDEDGYIVARCVIYTEVHTEDGKTLRLAERQYSTEGSNTLKLQLVLALINAGEIDGYKRVGASCHDARNFVLNNGTALECNLSIECYLDTGDALSYQDTFKWYNISERIAYNHDDCSWDYKLDTTEGSISGDDDDHEGECWSDYHDEYIPGDYAIWVDSRNDYFYDEEVTYANVWDADRGRFREEYCFDDDCLCIHGEYYYAGDNCNCPEDYGIYECPECCEYFIEEDAWHSELTDDYYCCEACMESAEQDYKERNWYYSEYDNEYYEDDCDVVEALMWNNNLSKYETTTIYVDTLNELFDDGEAVEFEGTIYIDEIGTDGEPAHIAAENFVAA